MCGIAGIVALRPVNPAAIEAMAGRQAHRGPDAQGLWTSGDGRVSLGHRRLAIIDTSHAADQPMSDAGGNHVLCFNGEIYNYREIAARLAAEGVTFATRSDSEVLLEAYKHWGEACLAELNGMFAFALWDKRRGILFCARDRFGEKPFLFARTGEAFAFASEYGALLGLDGVDATVDMGRLARFLATSSEGLDDGRQTVFAGIEQLLPGECLSLDLATLAVTIRRYWFLRPGEAPASEAEIFAQFRELLTDSVRLRLRSDVPVGSCLSGGLDSSAIVCIARALLGDDAPYHVFTGRFPDTGADEWPYATQVIESVGALSHVVAPSPQTLLDELGAFVSRNELPVGSSSQYAQWCVFRLAAESGITVLLDGQGADEVLGGYEQYFRHYAAIHPEEQSAIRERYPLALESLGGGLKRRMPMGLKRLLSDVTGRGSDIALGLVPPPAAREAGPVPEGMDELRNALYRDSFQTHLPTLLRYGDRNSMAHSREVRLPFCDHRLAEFVFSLPPHVLMGDAQTKRLLRESLRGVLPEGIRTRWNKRGFLPPQDLWLTQQPLAGHLRAIIEDSSFAQRGLWRQNWWRGILARLHAGEHSLAWTLWRPLITEAWFTHVVEPALRAPRLAMTREAP